MESFNDDVDYVETLEKWFRRGKNRPTNGPYLIRFIIPDIGITFINLIR